ncbi:class I SAM-dependent methyltransferase [Kaarinaea lacus]
MQRSQQIQNQIKDLPNPSVLEQGHSEQLIEYIRAKIDSAGGRISFAEFMSLALYAPGLGYYTAGKQKFGVSGDFITAPELSPLFSQCLARQCQQILSELHQQSTQALVILEAGGGSGVMAAQLLAELERLDSLPEQYFILELSADLRQRQQQTLTETVPHLMPLVQWLDTLPKQGIEGVLLANEVLDAMPVHRVVLDDHAQEYYVGWDGERFIWQTGEISSQALLDRVSALPRDLPRPYVTEINLAASAWVTTLASVIKKGVALLIDYGFPRHEYYHEQRRNGTLMCHYRHRSHDNPFVYPGLQDITAHVDFTAVADAAVDAGFNVAGFNTQGFFLLACGLENIIASVDIDSTEYIRLSQQIKLLTLPHEMGELFKVLALTKNFSAQLMGFSLQDLRSRL